MLIFIDNNGDIFPVLHDDAEGLICSIKEHLSTKGILITNAETFNRIKNFKDSQNNCLLEKIYCNYFIQGVRLEII